MLMIFNIILGLILGNFFAEMFKSKLLNLFIMFVVATLVILIEANIYILIGG